MAPRSPLLSSSSDPRNTRFRQCRAAVEGGILATTVSLRIPGYVWPGIASWISGRGLCKYAFWSRMWHVDWVRMFSIIDIGRGEGRGGK